MKTTARLVTNTDGSFALMELLVDEGKQRQQPQQSVPIDVMVVADCSGSMRGGRHRRVQQAWRMLVNKLRHGDRLGLVEFNNQTKIHCMTQVSTENRDTFCSWMNFTRCVGGTNVCAGVNQGLKELRKHATEKRAQYLILLSDGYANVGCVNTEEILAMLHDSGLDEVSAFAFSIGADTNTELLQTIGVSGMYSVLQHEDLATGFAHMSGGLLTAAVQDVEFVARGVDRVRRYGSLTWNDFGDRYAHRSTLSRGDRTSVLWEVNPSSLLDRFSVQWLDLYTGEAKSRTFHTREIDVDDDVIREAMLRLDGAKVIRQANVNWKAVEKFSTKIKDIDTPLARKLRHDIEILAKERKKNQHQPQQQQPHYNELSLPLLARQLSYNLYSQRSSTGGDIDLSQDVFATQSQLNAVESFFADHDI